MLYGICSKTAQLLFVVNLSSLMTMTVSLKCKSRYEAEHSVSVVSFVWNSILTRGAKWSR